MNKVIPLVFINLIVLNFGILGISLKHDQKLVTSPPVVQIPIEEPKAINYSIETPIPDFMEYDDIVNQLKSWNKEAPEITRIGIYGKTSRGKPLYYFRVAGVKSTKKKVVMITACIHGNEPLSTSTVMAYIGTVRQVWRR